MAELPDPESLLPPERDVAALMPDEALTSYLRSMASEDYAAKAGPLGMLRLLDPTRTALRAHEERLVAAALADGASWSQIGDALGVQRSNAYNRHRSLAVALREARKGGKA